MYVVMTVPNIPAGLTGVKPNVAATNISKITKGPT
jgi:hypothetical protein